MEPQEKNPLKAIVSKSGMYVQFDDENKILTIATPNKNKINISNKNKKITIQDENANSCMISSSGIDLNSQKSITISANQDIILKEATGVQIQAPTDDVQVKGMNIQHSADMEFAAQGGATAQITRGAQLTLKSAMVMIN